MNLCEIFVTNIISDIEEPDGWHTIVCDTDDWGNKKYGRSLNLSPEHYKDVKEKGYYLG